MDVMTALFDGACVYSQTENKELAEEIGTALRPQVLWNANVEKMREEASSSVRSSLHTSENFVRGKYAFSLRAREIGKCITIGYYYLVARSNHGSHVIAHVEGRGHEDGFFTCTCRVGSERLTFDAEISEFVCMVCVV